jgi:hypothetical protein
MAYAEVIAIQRVVRVFAAQTEDALDGKPFEDRDAV